jgi:hypothetical protein
MSLLKLSICTYLIKNIVMKKNHLKLFLFLTSLFLLQNSVSYTQDTIPSNYENNPNLKKGNWAVVFELGSMLWGSNYSYSSPNHQEAEKYYFLFKYQTGEKTAVRFGVNFWGYSHEYHNDSPANPYSSNYTDFFIGAGVNLQYYITKKYFAKPFISAGPFYDINFFKDYDSKYYNWNLGLDITFGAEMFVYKSVGIIAEYVMRTSFEKNYMEYAATASDLIGYTRYRWRNEANTSRLGVTFYF